MSCKISSVRWRMRVEGKEALGDGLQIGLREYEKGLPYIDELPEKQLNELKQAIRQEYNARQKIRKIVVPDGNSAVVAAGEIMDVIRMYVHGDNNIDYIAETVFQTDGKSLKPFFDLLGISDEKSDSKKKYNGSKPKITWPYRS